MFSELLLYYVLSTNNKGCMKIDLHTCCACSTIPVYSVQSSKNTTQRKLYYNCDAASHKWRVHDLLDYVVKEMQLFNALGDGGAFLIELGFLLVRVVMMDMMQQM